MLAARSCDSRPRAMRCGVPVERPVVRNSAPVLRKTGRPDEGKRGIYQDVFISCDAPRTTFACFGDLTGALQDIIASTRKLRIRTDGAGSLLYVLVDKGT